MYGAFPRSASRALATLAVITAAVIAGACSKGEPQSGKAQPKAPVASKPAATSTAKPDEVDAALKDRLARQEAASRMFERQVLEPPAPKVPEPPRSAQAKSEPKPEPRPETKAEPQAEAKPRPSPEARTEPRPEPRVEPKREPSPPPAVAASKPAPIAPPAPPRLITRVDPDFPAEALRAGVNRGTVRARMTLDGNGNVTAVEVLDSMPRRVFDRAVVRALSQWKYNDGVPGRTIDSEIEFKP
jgi:protein TonB